MKKININDFEYILKSKDEIIGIVIKNPLEYGLILKPNETLNRLIEKCKK